MTAAATPSDRPNALRGRPRLKAYVAESRGVHRRTDLGEGLPAGLHAWQLLMTDSGCFTGLTSALVRQWWLPPLPVATPVFMAMGLDDPRPMRRGVLTSRHTREIGFDEIDGPEVRLRSRDPARVCPLALRHRHGRAHRLRAPHRRGHSS